MKIEENNSHEDADGNLTGEVRAGDHSLVHFSGKKEVKQVIIFRKMAALPNIGSAGTGRYPPKPEHTATSSLPANKESHILSPLKGGIS